MPSLIIPRWSNPAERSVFFFFFFKGGNFRDYLLWCACVLFQCLRLVVMNVSFPFPSLSTVLSLHFLSLLFSFVVSVSLLRPTGRGSGWLRKMLCLRGRIVQRMRWVRQQGSVWHSALEREMLWKWSNGACSFFICLFCSPAFIVQCLIDL